jgi:oxygen-independent coproporphyrinogen-3 oxidase
VFETWNLDLMYGLPGQTLAGLSADLDQALAFAPPHLSIYQLTIEANTRFANAPPQLPDDDETSLMLDEIVARADAVGLARYEVSAFARNGHRCKHNHNYWTFGDYLGLGAGAHGKLSFAHHVLRQVRWRDPATYVEHALAGKAVSNESGVGRRDLAFEFMLNALRLRDGFAIELFNERTAMPSSAIAKGLQLAQDRGLIRRDGNWIRPTVLGFDFLSDLQTLFLPD